MTGTGDADGHNSGGEAVVPGSRLRATRTSLASAARKTAVIAPAALLVSYTDARFVRASTGELGWFFGIEFWLMTLVLGGLWVRGRTADDDSWVGVCGLAVLLAGFVAGPLLVLHPVWAGPAAAGVLVMAGPVTAIGRACGFWR
ncbi:hypothetical protein [Streptomyces sp. NPDC049970]|uniref:hypothetical protein n=1 Tax=Streptomyces sp. NPDC049970 TaxID=3155033 RepID=UPI003431C366